MHRFSELPYAARRLDLSRLLAEILCAAFALVGATPFLGQLLLGSAPVQRWAATETARVLREQLGVTARYEVKMSLWPLELGLRHVVIGASDGGSPALTAERIRVTPRIFSLLAGRLDVGDIELERPRARLVLRQGKVANVRYRIPETRGPSRELKRSPFTSLALTGAELSLDWDGIQVQGGPMDVDVFSERNWAFELAVRAAQTRITRQRDAYWLERPWLDNPGSAKTLVRRPVWHTVSAEDDDVICRLDLRARLEQSDVLIRRLSLLGVVDSDPKPGKAPGCDRAEREEDPWRLAVRLSGLRIARTGAPVVDGHVVVRAPLALTNRFVRTLPLQGWAGFTGDLHYDKGHELPEVHGRVRGGGIVYDFYRLAKDLDVDLNIERDVVRIPSFKMVFADGDVALSNARIEPMKNGVPLSVQKVVGRGMRFEGLMRDLGVTENTVIRWDFHDVLVSEAHGTIRPLKLDAKLNAETRDFEVFDRSFRDPARRHMIGVQAASVRGHIGVRPTAFEFYDTHASFGKSAVYTSLVSIGFKNQLRLVVPKGAHIDLGDVSPLVDIPWSGKAALDVEMVGESGDPLLTGEMSIEDFVFAGYSFGNVTRSKVSFRPLKLDISDLHATKGSTEYRVSSGRLNFDTDASVLVDASVDSASMDIRDFLTIWHFDQDPRFDQVRGRTAVKADVHYALGGKEDRCGGGNLTVDGSANLARAELFEEAYDGGRAEFHLNWYDRRASYLGFNLDVPSITLRKGPGTLLGSLSVRTGGKLEGHLAGTAVPLSKIDSLGLGKLPIQGQATGVLDISGSIDELSSTASVQISPLRIGRQSLKGSAFVVELAPPSRPLVTTGTTRCGNAITPPFDRAEYDRDLVLGTYRITGELFGGQVNLNNLQLTRQRSKKLRGKVELANFDFSAAAELYPTATGDSGVTGRVSAAIDIQELPLDKWTAGAATVKLSQLALERGRLKLKLLPDPETVTLKSSRIAAPGLVFGLSTSAGELALLDAQGSVSGLGAGETVDASVRLRKTDLSKALVEFLPQAHRASGELSGELRVTGPRNRLEYRGLLELKKGELLLRGMPSPISEIELALAVEGGELQVRRGTAKLGGGTIQLRGGAPLRGFELGPTRLFMSARQIRLPIEKGIKSTVDADLVADWRSGDTSQRALPKITGDVTVRSFEYARPIVMSADLATLAQRGKQTQFDLYDPADDVVDFNLSLHSTVPLKIHNNLADAELLIDDQGLEFAGTNQRFGARGLLRLKPGGRIRLRRNEFEVKQGFVRFDDLTHIAPQVDVTAVTDYRRYSELSGANSASSGSTSASGGKWLITMHAYGDADKLRIDLTSDPVLAQDDIFLLLTVGLTRAELDQARSASAGESVALEALGTLTGADRAVTEAVPIIDEFRFGSSYSSRTGRTEPTVTIGKRLAERIRANVTSGVAESREVRSNVEWNLSPNVSVESSYDNVNDISSSSLGNLGADIRWSLEFE